MTDKSLEKDPDNQAAQKLLETIKIFATDIAGQIEIYPIDDSRRTYGAELLITGTLFPVRGVVLPCDMSIFIDSLLVLIRYPTDSLIMGGCVMECVLII